ncbi:DNA recombination protein RmuC [Arcticibacter pallidicorallinus]|uniref:DNA recombination protein RmuC n=1 Tax=Arcticibacter pallidicorallinus TaxID=1259464 RepID=A0A2T0U7L0_9SPHI|nr:DNA recombination protein RmuC [Arcticibacter pallidicorallinus]PRY53848.1 DNA recombination protein RmuC [Arcticibacter pallidicorallinus]
MDSTTLVILLLLSLLTNAYLWYKQRSEDSLTADLKVKADQLTNELIRYEERYNAAKTEKENLTSILRQEQERLFDELQAERQKLTELSQLYEGNKAYLRAQQEKIAEQKEEVALLQIKFNKDFELIANKILEEKSLKFTEVNRFNIDALLSPLKENIKLFEQKVDRVYKSESDERNVLKGEISKLMELNKQISEEASNLTRALKADTKKQGNWGEVILDRILEASGLILGESYIKQTSFTDEDGNRLQPDVVVTLPDNKHMIIDSKVSLIAYDRLVNCETDADKLNFLNDHITSIKAHIKNLCGKNYCDLYGINSPDFVLLFVPIESSFAVAVKHDLELFEYAWSRRVVIVTPSTLLATLKTISSVWKQEQQTRNAIDIATKAGALYDKFVGFTNDLRKIGDKLDDAKSSYADAFGKLSSGSGNLVGRVETLKKLGAKASKRIDPKFMLEEE